MRSVPAVTLNDGNTIPQLGFGVFQIEPDQTASAVRTALDVGYRHVDTAEMYGNEKEVGDGARRAFDATLTALGSDYIDLFLIHWPLPTLYDGDFVSTWNVLEEFVKDGRARIESNFEIFDFSLTDEDMAAITGLDRGESGRAGPDPDTFDHIPD